MRLVIRL